MLTPVATSSSQGEKIIFNILHRFENADSSCQAAVQEILAAVREKKDQALVEYARRYDAPHFAQDQLSVSGREFQDAYDRVDDDFLTALAKAGERIRTFHEREMEDSWLQTREDGTITGRLVRPVDSAGLYVPGGRGGTTPLVSSVLMNGIPARIAGVSRRVMITPPNREGEVSPHLLVAAREIGVTEVYKAGSAWAIAALAFGTETIPRVDVIVGPGNQYVAEAKRLVSGMVRIDMIAGPSEVLIIADEGANAAFIAADMLAQAEHDVQARAMAITTDQKLAERIPGELDRQLARLSRRDIARRAIKDFGAILVAEDLKEAIGLANDIAVEHLELMIDDPWAQIPYIRHAGAVFLGQYAPEAAGDYIAGPNHVLPTMGTARFASALGVETFLKKSSIISYSENGLRADSEHIQMLARLEGLTAHAASVHERLK